DERAADAGPPHGPAPAARVPRRRLPRHGRRPAAKPREERHRRVSDERRGLLAVAGAALLWSTGGVGIKAVDAPPLAIAGWRSACAPVVLLPWSGPLRGASGIFLASMGCSAGCLPTFVVATKWTTAANAIFLQYTGVVWVLLLSPLVTGEPR